ncbi:hypothetical protein RCCWILLIS_89 [Rhodobacter phage RcCWillis]|nr:hypothetical protein RCCWILLIS_89 [Rhodobacter phage RcCWillis]
MNIGEIKLNLQRLRDAASAQGMDSYDHTQALDDAGIKERGDDLGPLAARWAAALPAPYRILVDYENAEKPTGLDMVKVYQRALDKVEGEVKWG